MLQEQVSRLKTRHEDNKESGRQASKKMKKKKKEREQLHFFLALHVMSFFIVFRRCFCCLASFELALLLSCHSILFVLFFFLIPVLTLLESPAWVFSPSSSREVYFLNLFLSFLLFLMHFPPSIVSRFLYTLCSGDKERVEFVGNAN